MTKKNINDWIMYHEIHQLNRLGFSASKIALHLGLDARTVRKRLAMTEAGFEAYLLRLQHRNKVLSVYEDFVINRLRTYPDTSTAQIHDWLKEHYKELPKVTPRTVYNFVMYVRQKHNIPVIPIEREYFPIEELPFGEQAQVDFGECNLRCENGKRKKVWFFAMVLSRSRMKHVYFLDKPFTAHTVCRAHEAAFKFFGGIPQTIVYDQDRTMVVDENLGDVILTKTFKAYTKSRSFKLHFCRKADPESKGKVENVIQYVKKNFLYNRPYADLQILNTQAIAWLERTANALPHNSTKEIPEVVFCIEKPHLKPYVPITLKNEEVKKYYVRKTNTIAYKSNFYSVPMGTYISTGTWVIVKQNEATIEIYDVNDALICTHKLCPDKGKTIVNTSHKRDTSMRLEEMISTVAGHFTNREKAEEYLRKIQERLPRYTRDHLQVILKVLKNAPQDAIDKTLNFCLKNKNISGHEFEQVLHVYGGESTSQAISTEIKPLNNKALEKANETPQTSNIQDYENIINP